MKKRPDGRYQKQLVIGITPEGKPIRKYFYGTTLSEIDKKYRDFMQLKDRGAVLNNNKMTMQQLFDTWLENENRPIVTKQTYMNNKKAIGKMIRDNFADVPVTDFNLYHIEQYRNKMIANGTINTFNRNLSHLRTILDYAIRHDVIVRNVAQGASKLKYEPSKRRALTADEVQKVKNAQLGKMDRVFVDILFYTGMRSGEVLALAVDDIDFKLGRINVSKTINGLHKIQDHTKTESGMRSLPIPVQLHDTLKEWCEIVECGYLFASRTGNVFGSYAKDVMWQRIKQGVFGAEEPPIEFTPHLFRHNYASDLYKAGIDLKTAQYLLGHSKIEVTMDIYTHFESNDVSIDKLESFYDKQNNFSQNLVSEPIVSVQSLANRA